jgi:putative ATPase
VVSPNLRKLIQEALDYQSQQQKKAIIFIDEIHRFSKSQQDALLPYLEAGSFILLGATTEYPQTSLNRAILSRVRCLELKALTKKNISDILTRALETKKLTAADELIELITDYANGDARVALGHLEMLMNLSSDLTKPDLAAIKEQLLQNARLFDKDSDRHYDVISAFIKSIRGSDTDASLLWLAVMIDGGEDPVFIARRLMIAASEDIGNADPRALQLATNAHYAVSQIGMPEARIILAQATTYLAQAPKSNSSYLAIDKALAFVQSNPTIEVPTHLRNHHLDKKNYKYPHNYPHHWISQNYTPTPSQTFYHSSEIGMEKVLTDYQRKIRSKD